MEIISYNVNGIRAAVKNGLIDWLKMQSCDVLCLQEIKVSREDFDPRPFNELGFDCYIYPAVKKGYSGVGVFTRIKPKRVVEGCGKKIYDDEGRNLRLDFDGVSVMSAYFPSGTTGDERQAVKMQYLDYIYDYTQKLKEEFPMLAIAGDYNICHRPIDIHDPVRNKDVSGFKPEERAWMEKFFNSGFIDSFRKFHPEPHQYSWWSYRANARANNKGWRIDYIATTEALSASLQNACIYQEAIHSDHCPVYIKLKF